MEPFRGKERETQRQKEDTFIVQVASAGNFTPTVANIHFFHCAFNKTKRLHPSIVKLFVMLLFGLSGTGMAFGKVMILCANLEETSVKNDKFWLRSSVLGKV